MSGPPRPPGATALLEGPAQRIARRALSIPALWIGLAAWLVSAPVLLPLALLAGVIRRDRGTLARLFLFAGVYLVCENLGILASAALWLLFLGRRETGAHANAHYAMQSLWAATLFRAARTLFQLEFRCQGESGPGPLLLFMRHASILDTLLPANLIAPKAGLRLRYVLKRELLLDPCLDVVGQRLPNVFVRRASGSSKPEVDAIRKLARDLGTNDAVLIYPEGTRTSPERRARALEKISESGDEMRLARARALRVLLPPRSGGPLALLDAATDADVLFVAHAGLDGVTRVKDVLSGALVGRRIGIFLRRVCRAEIPTTREERLEWLDTEWAEVDAWVAEQNGLRD